MKRHPAVASHEQPRAVIVVALLEDDVFAACGVTRYAVQLDSCIRRCDPGETGVSVYLEHGIADVERLTVIFALWPDEQFSQRLVDTGWQSWQADWLIGSSTKALDYKDTYIEEKYKDRLNVWSSILP